jgi:hypothetical protein
VREVGRQPAGEPEAKLLGLPSQRGAEADGGELERRAAGG